MKRERRGRGASPDRRLSRRRLERIDERKRHDAGQSRGGDIVVSEMVTGDPAAAAIIEALAMTQESAAIKGFAEPVPFRRLLPDAAVPA